MDSDEFLEIFKAVIMPLDTGYEVKYISVFLTFTIPVFIFLSIMLSISLFREDDIRYSKQYKRYTYRCLSVFTLLYSVSLIFLELYVKLGSLLLLVFVTGYFLYYLSQEYREVYFIE